MLNMHFIYEHNPIIIKDEPGINEKNSLKKQQH